MTAISAHWMRRCQCARDSTAVDLRATALTGRASGSLHLVYKQHPISRPSLVVIDGMRERDHRAHCAFGVAILSDAAGNVATWQPRWRAETSPVAKKSACERSSV
ncbi:hypothetical protein XAC3810_320149 [Xanthomonas citri pv. citri]|nr:hypothetical protein XAC3810_320149 [Xanthomonas citri pv. citri]CEE59308.1 hypothetical protein XAC71A_450001 [Xanthomonas citri pv. citri]CEE63543.1 hypothetical protein XACW160_360001 [Xanthomonas citri pv. citri]CEH41940.1 hypothetical protein XACJK48_3980002 [Xanthomonas citri pv. citri]CEH48705.1 hypothetical protein XAC3615_13720002 [Xanthomonas citri pv. citri]